MKIVVERHQAVEINGMRFQVGENALHPTSDKALTFLKKLPSVWDNPNRSKFYTDTPRTREGICIEYKRIPGCIVTREKYKVDASRGIPSRTETPCMTLDIEFTDSFFDNSCDCRNCFYMEADNRGFCWNPSRCDQDGDPGFSEVTAQREAAGERCWCENYKNK